MKYKCNNSTIYANEYSCKKFKELMDYLYNNNFYYNALLKKIGYRDKEQDKEFIELYSRLPISNKQTIKKHFNTYLTYNNDELIREYTSGSTGEPLTCYKTLAERNMHALTIWNMRRKIDNSVNPNTFLELFGKINTVGIDFTIVNDKNFKKIIDYLNIKRPRWICSSPTIIYQYALKLKEKNISLNYIKYIELEGEYVDPYERSFIEEIFNAKTIVQYGMRESWTIAYECRFGMMHLLDKLFILEMSQENHIIITSLNNKCMPLIRYDTGDTGKIFCLSKCLCQANETVSLDLCIGRKANSIEGHPGLIGDIVFKRVVQRVVCNFNGKSTIINSFYVIQKSINKFIFHIEKGIDYVSEIEYLIIKKTKEYLGNDIVIMFDYSINKQIGDTGKGSIFRKAIEKI